jgi:hypothetical protein
MRGAASEVDHTAKALMALGVGPHDGVDGSEAGIKSKGLIV